MLQNFRDLTFENGKIADGSPNIYKVIEFTTKGNQINALVQLQGENGGYYAVTDVTVENGKGSWKWSHFLGFQDNTSLEDAKSKYYDINFKDYLEHKQNEAIIEDIELTLFENGYLENFLTEEGLNPDFNSDKVKSLSDLFPNNLIEDMCYDILNRDPYISYQESIDSVLNDNLNDFREEIVEKLKELSKESDEKQKFSR